MKLRQIIYIVSAASFIILSATFFTGCSTTWSWVRQGTKVDSLEMTVRRVDSLSKVQNKLLTELNADLLTEIENIRQDLAQLSAKIEDSQTRVYQKFVVPRNEAGRNDTTIRTYAQVDPDELYNTAYLDFTRSNYDVAIDGFKRYLQYFPNTELSDNAQYWIGECYYSKKLFPDAVLEFEKVIANYPDGNKVVSANYKIGLAYESMNENRKAKEYYKRVFDNYPNTPEAKLARERFNTIP